jgi:UDP-N-acetylmuramoyl-tripeptide--D-alanyl-D-alanine ligase
MLNLELADIARWTGGRLHGASVRIESVSTDTRCIAPGALFVALRGERHDAHDFVEAAHSGGAVALLVERELSLEVPQVIVADSLIALGDLAAAVRQQRSARVIGITGSNGKTTVKTLLASILARHGRTHVNAGNLNNEIGLPLTLLAMPADSEYAVLEMGAGKPGDIDYLARIAHPQIGLVNNVAPAHLERMGSLDGIAETKGALYASLPGDGVAVINADDAYAGYFAGLAGQRRILRFGFGSAAEVTARLTAGASGNSFMLVAAIGEIQVDLPLPGRHNVLNALAAAALALALDVPLATIKAGLEAAPQVAGRHVRRTHPSGAEVIDDSYNANPASFAAAIAILAAERGAKILVVGDMRELGNDGERLHAEIGALARSSGIDRLLAVGVLSRAAADAFGNGGTHYADQAALVAALRGELHGGTTVLIKGSRGSAMDRVVRALVDAEDMEGGRHAA